MNGKARIRVGALVILVASASVAIASGAAGLPNTGQRPTVVTTSNNDKNDKNGNDDHGHDDHGHDDDTHVDNKNPNCKITSAHVTYTVEWRATPAPPSYRLKTAIATLTPGPCKNGQLDLSLTDKNKHVLGSGSSPINGTTVSVTLTPLPRAIDVTGLSIVVSVKGQGDDSHGGDDHGGDHNDDHGGHR